MWCHGLGAKTQSLKFLFVNICFQRACASARMIKGVLEVLMLCCLNIIRWCLSTAAFGISMMGASMRKCRNPMSITGRRNFMETGNVMSAIGRNWKGWDGKSSQCGNANWKRISANRHLSDYTWKSLLHIEFNIQLPIYTVLSILEIHSYTLLHNVPLMGFKEIILHLSVVVEIIYA